jgi:N-acyl homoserine lactone hydrolase
MDFVESYYLIKHASAWFLWDTGIPDAVAAIPNGRAGRGRWPAFERVPVLA